MAGLSWEAKVCLAGLALLAASACGGGSGEGGSGGTGTGGSGSGGSTTTCTTGDEGCACYPNKTCNLSTLACLSSLCVSPGGTGGTPALGGSSGTGGAANGGAPGSGGVPASGGRSGSGGVVTSGGSLGTGGAQGGTGGTTATGGAPKTGGVGAVGGTSNTGGIQGSGGATGTGGTTCGDTTSDWHNCGSCGHVCANQGQSCGTSCCVAGQCSNYWGPCFDGSSGFKTCAAACASVGAVCVAKGCEGQYTWEGWGGATASNCPSLRGAGATSTATCDSTLPYTGESTTVRCCCVEP